MVLRAVVALSPQSIEFCDSVCVLAGFVRGPLVATRNRTTNSTHSTHRLLRLRVCSLQDESFTPQQLTTSCCGGGSYLVVGAVRSRFVQIGWSTADGRCKWHFVSWRRTRTLSASLSRFSIASPPLAISPSLPSLSSSPGWLGRVRECSLSAEARWRAAGWRVQKLIEMR
jgi:hypothetical protein